ncbi:MAG: hypothetical protein MRY32_06210 [Rickettsiales bacterium]|nr:hypothetical protein [Rickettsiales bacterium]
MHRIIEDAPIRGEYRVFGIEVRPLPITPAGFNNVVGLYKLLIITYMIFLICTPY